jgi:hypothetical protein
MDNAAPWRSLFELAGDATAAPKEFAELHEVSSLRSHL